MHPTEHHSHEESIPIHFEAPKEKPQPRLVKSRYGTVEPVRSLQDIMDMNKEEREN